MVSASSAVPGRDDNTTAQNLMAGGMAGTLWGGTFSTLKIPYKWTCQFNDFDV